MAQFVRVRLTQADKFDLSIFQFDYDMSFAVFLMNADGTIYGRYGTRSDFADSEREISLAGLRLALETALEWHARHPVMAESLAGKRGPEPKFRSYGQFPTGTKSRYSRSFGNLGRCTHCHDVRTAQQLAYRVVGEPIPERVVFAWPMPNVIGLRLDPGQRARVHTVVPGTPAATSGFLAGDDLLRLNGQPLLSIADVQWVLHQAKDSDELSADVIRGGESLQLSIKLPKGWRRNASIGWRSTTRVLRKKWLNGVEYRTLFAKDRLRLGLAPNVLALRAARGVSRNSKGPIRRDDILIEIDGRSDPLTEEQFMAYVGMNKKPGSTMNLKLLRGNDTIDIVVPIP